MRKCTSCWEQSQVIDSRQVHDYVRRRRRCLKCKTRFTTREITQEEFDRLQSVDRIPGKVTDLLREALGLLEETNGS